MTRKSLIPHSELRRLAQKLVELQRRIERMEWGSRSTQLEHSSIEGGSLVIRDANGNVRGAVGMQPSGNSAVRTINNPPPFRPNTPEVTPIPGGVAVTWNGELVNGVPDPDNFSHVEVYFSGAGPDFIHGPSNMIGRLYAAGSIPVTPLPQGDYYARLVAVNKDNPPDSSEPSLTGGPAQPGQTVADDVLDGIITEVKLAQDAVTEAKLAAGAVTETKIANDAVSTPKLVAGAVQAEQIASGAVLADKIAAGAVTTEKLDALAVTADKIAANAIESAHIKAGAVDASKLAATLVIAGEDGGNRVQLSQFNGIEQYINGQRTLWIPPQGRSELTGSIRIGSEAQHISIVPADEETSFPRIAFLDDNTIDRRAAMYFQFDTLLLRRETIVPEEYEVGEVRGGQVSLGHNTHFTHFHNASGATLGAVDLYDDGRTRIVGRKTDGDELGAWDIQETGHCWLTAEQSLNINARGNPAGDLNLSAQQWHVNVNSARDINLNAGFSTFVRGNLGVNLDSEADVNIDAEGNTWIRAEGDINLRADTGIFLRSNADSSGDYAELRLYPNGETGVVLNGNDDPGEIFGLKPFVIQHPDDPDRWLVHGCTESPMAGVEYWGEAEIVSGRAEVELPSYFESLTLPENRQVQLTPIDELCMVAASRIENGRFTIKCSGPDGTKVAWLVKAERRDAAGFEVEPLKSDVIVRGDGPYRYPVRKRERA